MQPLYFRCFAITDVHRISLETRNFMKVIAGDMNIVLYKN